MQRWNLCEHWQCHWTNKHWEAEISLTIIIQQSFSVFRHLTQYNIKLSGWLLSYLRNHHNYSIQRYIYIYIRSLGLEKNPESCPKTETKLSKNAATPKVFLRPRLILTTTMLFETHKDVMCSWNEKENRIKKGVIKKLNDDLIPTDTLILLTICTRYILSIALHYNHSLREQHSFTAKWNEKHNTIITRTFTERRKKKQSCSDRGWGTLHHSNLWISIIALQMSPLPPALQSLLSPIDHLPTPPSTTTVSVCRPNSTPSPSTLPNPLRPYSFEMCRRSA